MRKLSIIATVLLLLTTACQKEESYVYKLETEHYAANGKVHLDSENYAVWDAGDSVFVLSADGTMTGAPISHSGGSYEIELQSPLAEGDMLLYRGPYGAGMSFCQDTNHHYYLQINSQKYRTLPDGTQLLAAPMAAYYNGGSSVTFYNLMALMEVTVENNTDNAITLQHISLEASEALLQGRFALTADNGRPRIEAVNDECGSLMSLNFFGPEAVLAAGGQKSFLVALPPFAAGNTFTLRVRGIGSTSMICDMTSSTTPALEASQLAVGLTANNFSAASVSLDGDGTENSPYRIYTALDITNVANLVKNDIAADAYYELMNDIVDDGQAEIIGTIHHPFRGHFNGNGHTISNVQTGMNFLHDRGNGLYRHYQGVFGRVEDAHIHHLTVQGNFVISEPVHTQNMRDITMYVGILCAECWGHTVLDHIVTNGTITTVNPAPQKLVKVGGLVGDCSGTITFTNCTNNVAITLNATGMYVGGFAGMHSGQLTMTNCVNTGNITTTATSVAIGMNNKANIGGFVGSIFDDEDYQYHINIDRCRNSGNIIGRYDQDFGVGGLFGYVFDGVLMNPSICDPVVHVSNFVNTGNISAISTDNDDAYAGGLVGKFDSDGYGSETPWFYNCLNKGNVSASGNDARSGGICGYGFDDDTRYVLCVNTGTISAEGDPYTGYISGKNGTVLYVYSCPETTMPPTVSGTYVGDHHGASYNQLNTGDNTLNNARVNTDKNQHTQWSATEWGTFVTASGTKACRWTGSVSSDHNTLDLDF